MTDAEIFRKVRTRAIMLNRMLGQSVSYYEIQMRGKDIDAMLRHMDGVGRTLGCVVMIEGIEIVAEDFMQGESDSLIEAFGEPVFWLQRRTSRLTRERSSPAPAPRST